MSDTRRGFLSRSALGVLACAGASLGFADDTPPAEAGDDPAERIPDGSASKNMITPRTEQAIQRGLTYLSTNAKADGSFGLGNYHGNVAVTSLAAMAFMCAGHQPNRGVYGKIITKALRFVLNQENRGGLNPGYLHNTSQSSHGPMYGHGFATLFLSEVVGMVHEKSLREELREKLGRAIKLILDSQKRNPEGAWRYTPNATDADLSVTICQIMALRSARNAGIMVPKAAVDRCTAYVKACQDKMEGWFRYQKSGGGGGGQQGFARTAAGVCALNAAGIYKGREVEAGLKFLEQNKPGRMMGRTDIHYFYGHYYAVQAMWTAGGKYWTDWYPGIRDELLARQNAGGFWHDSLCTHYGTAMACVILQVPNNYLPILQK